MENQRKVYFDISLGVILKIWLTLILFWFLYQIKEVVVILFASIFLTFVVSPLVDKLEKRKIPRGVGAFFIYLIVIGVIVGFIAFLVPPLLSQTQEFGRNLPNYAGKIGNVTNEIKGYFEHLATPSPEFLKNIGERMGSLVTDAYEMTVGILGGFFTTLLVLVLSFYMVVEKSSLEETLLVVLPKSKVNRLVRIFDDIETKIGHWIQGQLVLMLIIGVLSYVALWVLGVKYALTLAIIAGILEAVPYVGPIVSGLVAAGVALLESPILAMWVMVAFTVIQQLENVVFVPKVMGKFVGLSPVIIIVAMIVGGKFLGLGGVILAIPIATSIAVVIKDFIDNPLEENKA